MFRLVTFVGALVVLAFIGYLLSRPALNEGTLEKTNKLILSQPFSCPADTHEQVKRWYLDGYVRRCLDNKEQREGPMIGWRSQTKVVDGQYHNDLREGDWHWYNKRGELLRQEHYRNGRKIGDTVPARQAPVQ